MLDTSQEVPVLGHLFNSDIVHGCHSFVTCVIICSFAGRGENYKVFRHCNKFRCLRSYRVSFTHLLSRCPLCKSHSSYQVELISPELHVANNYLSINLNERCCGFVHVPTGIAQFNCNSVIPVFGHRYGPGVSKSIGLPASLRRSVRLNSALLNTLLPLMVEVSILLE